MFTSYNKANNLPYFSYFAAFHSPKDSGNKSAKCERLINVQQLMVPSRQLHVQS